MSTKLVSLWVNLSVTATVIRVHRRFIIVIRASGAQRCDFVARRKRTQRETQARNYHHQSAQAAAAACHSL